MRLVKNGSFTDLYGGIICLTLRNNRANTTLTDREITTSRFSSIMSWVVRVQIPKHDMENKDNKDSFTHFDETMKTF